MPSYDPSLAAIGISVIDPAIFDDGGAALRFNCDGYQVTIFPFGNGQLEVHSKKDLVNIQAGPFTLADATTSMLPLARPETFAVLSMLNQKYQAYKAKSTPTLSYTYAALSPLQLKP